MYVGSNSITKLAAFLRGFDYALEKQRVGREDAFLPRFQELVQTRFRVTLSKSWEEIILFQCVDEKEAMDLFWQLFDEYCSTASQPSSPADK